MATNTQTMNINNFVTEFINTHMGTAFEGTLPPTMTGKYETMLIQTVTTNILESWESEENMDNLKKMLPKISKTSPNKKNKDPSKPKRGKSAYLFFCADHREEAKTELGDDAKATTVTSKLAEMWGEFKDNKKMKKQLEKYEKMAGEDKARYELEMNKYIPLSDEELMSAKKSKKSSANKDPNKPKHGKSSYMFFCAETREKAKTELGPEAKATEVTTELGRLWTEFKDDKTMKKKLEKYEKMAAEDKARYVQEMEEYTPPSDSDEIEPKKKKTPSPKKTSPPRKMSAYSFFCKENREEVKDDNSELPPIEITKLLAKMWGDLDDDEKSEWKNCAENE